MTRPQLHLVDVETGELVIDDRDILIDQLKGELTGKSLQIGKLKKELRELRAVEPEAEVIRDVLGYWAQRIMPTAVIAPAGKRWEKVRARLRERLDERDPWTPAELKLAVDGALLDPWLSGRQRGSRGFLDAETIFRDAEMVEKLRDLAMGFAARAGVHLGDLLEVVDELAYIDWKFQLRVCLCSHRRFEHSRGDPSRDGREVCLAQGCNCPDFDQDSYDEFNQRVDPWLREHFGRDVA